jgi:hypothetical protein
LHRYFGCGNTKGVKWHFPKCLGEATKCFGKYASMSLQLQSCLSGHLMVGLMWQFSWLWKNRTLNAFWFAKLVEIWLQRDIEWIIKLRISREGKGIRAFW